MDELLRSLEMRIDRYNDFLNSHKDCTEEYLLEQKAKIAKDTPEYEALLSLLSKFDDQRRTEADRTSSDRHRESILESQASRRLDKWALSVAVVALLVGGAGL